jgi:hypothetical protein
MDYRVKTTLVNEDQNCRTYDDLEYEHFDSPGEAFRAMREQYGRCTDHIYIDKKDGSTTKLGWVFVKREKYTDCNEYYLQCAWCSLVTHTPASIQSVEIT